VDGLGEGGTFEGAASRYRVVAEAGAGATGHVYRAVDERTGGAVAIKRLSLASEAARVRFRREARALLAVRDDAVVPYVDEGDSAEGPWIAMAWLDGPTLREHVAQGPLDEVSWRGLAARLARGLAAIHDAGLVHRDLKPANVVLPGGDPARATIVDFGLARREDDAEATVTGASVGTPAYMAPEQARAERGHTRAADLFSLGAVLYECACGTPPFRGQSAIAVLAKVLTLRPEPLRPRVGWVSAALDDLVVRRLLSRRPEGRPGDARSVLDVLASSAHRSDASTCSGEELELLPVTLLFARAAATEVTASTETMSDVAPERSRDPWIAACTPFGGRVEPLPDGTMLALFSRPGSATDSAAMAARAALAIREVSPFTRIVLATGTVLASEITEEVTSEAASAALALLDRETTPEIALDDVTRSLLGPTFAVTERDERFRLEGRVEAPLPGRIVRGRSVPLVGRELELGTLELAAEHAFEARTAVALVVVAPPGAGKSTLASAIGLRLVARHALRVVRARGDELLVGAPYAFLGELLTRRFGVEHRGGDPRARVEALARALAEAGCHEDTALTLGSVLAPADVGRDPALARARLLAATREWLETDARDDALVLVLDDLHWADPPSLQVLDGALGDLTRPVVLLGFSRPCQTRYFPEIGGREMPLTKLAPRAAEALLRAVLGDPRVGAPALRPLVELADGNPLFLEELARLVPEGEAPVARAAGSVLAILQARCASLDPISRRVLRAASVLGTTFDRADLVALLDADTLASAGEALVTLEREDLVLRAADREGEKRRFRHALVAEAAYSLLPHEDRASLHARAYDTLVRAERGSHAELGLHAARAGRRAAAAVHHVRAAEEWVAASDIARAMTLVHEALAWDPPPAVAAEAKVLGSIAAFFAGDIPLSMAWGLEGILGAPRASAAWTRCVGYLMAVVGHVSPRSRPPALDEALTHLIALDVTDELLPTAAEALALATQVLAWAHTPESAAMSRALVAKLEALGRAPAADALTHAWVAFGLGWGAHYAGLWHEPVSALAARARARFLEARDARNTIAADALLARALAGEARGADEARMALHHADQALDAARRIGGLAFAFAELHAAATWVVLVARGHLERTALDGAVSAAAAASAALPHSIYVRTEANFTRLAIAEIEANLGAAKRLAEDLLAHCPPTMEATVLSVLIEQGSVAHAERASELLQRATGLPGIERLRRALATHG